MFHRWAALGLVLALWAMSPKNAAGQTSKAPRGPSVGAFGKPYPNPFNPEVRIPFSIGTPDCADAGQQYDVTIQIKNILAQVVAIPVLEGAGKVVSSGTSGFAGGLTPVSHLRLSCGNYSAYWDGNVLGTQKEAASGIYVVIMLVDGQLSGTKRIFNRK